MKKINKINPIAKELPKFGKRVVPDKRRDKEEKKARQGKERCHDLTRFKKRLRRTIC